MSYQNIHLPMRSQQTEVRRTCSRSPVRFAVHPTYHAGSHDVQSMRRLEGFSQVPGIRSPGGSFTSSCSRSLVSSALGAWECHHTLIPQRPPQPIPDPDMRSPFNTDSISPLQRTKRQHSRSQQLPGISQHTAALAKPSPAYPPPPEAPPVMTSENYPPPPQAIPR